MVKISFQLESVRANWHLLLDVIGLLFASNIDVVTISDLTLVGGSNKLSQYEAGIKQKR